MRVPVTVLCEGVELEGALYDVALTIDMTDDDGLRPVAVKVAAQKGSPPIASTTLRSVKVGELTREALALVVEPRARRRTGLVGPHARAIDVAKHGMDPAQHTVTITPNLDDEARARLRQQGPTDEALAWVAYFYNLATLLGLPPARHVEVNLGLPRTTASKWVRRARERGLLGNG
ncbi:hypothetical protein V5H98_15230 [Georgenia sp. M64]|uniref:hypothetical protein n=1 Tax=Georgenia sp. M64 TaxID=3120520 RepID=UPI0030E40D4D